MDAVQLRAQANGNLATPGWAAGGHILAQGGIFHQPPAG